MRKGLLCQSKSKRGNQEYLTGILTRSGPMPKLKLLCHGTLMRLATGFWVSLAGLSVRDSLAGSSAFTFNGTNAPAKPHEIKIRSQKRGSWVRATNSHRFN